MAIQTRAPRGSRLRTSPAVPDTGSPPDFSIIDIQEFESKAVSASLIVKADGSIDAYQEVVDKGLISIGIAKGKFRVHATQYVGIIPFNDRLILNVKPRVPLRNLTSMVVQAGLDPTPINAMRSYGISASKEQWMSDLLADSLLDHVGIIRERGVLREYVRRSERSTNPRGRLNFPEMLKTLQARGVRHVASSTWYERIPDTPENRCLKAALLEVFHMYSSKSRRDKPGNRERVRRANTAIHTFTAVQADPYRHFMRDEVVLGLRALPETRAYYRPALDVALRVLRRDGVKLEGRDAVALQKSLLIHMGHLFESYVRGRLQAHAATAGWDVDVLDGNLQEGTLSLYQDAPSSRLAQAPGRQPPPGIKDPKIRMTPDIVFRSPSGSHPLIADLKNKPTNRDMPHREDVEQVATYALRYQCKTVLLIYPRLGGRERGMQPVGNVGDVTVFQYHYDLEATDMESEVSSFAAEIRRLIPS